MDAPFRPSYRTDEERFWSKVDKTGDCWVWTGALTRGYGVFRIRPGNSVAHRVSYQWENGPIPDGYEVDHMCFNRACVRPSHLRLLTHVENGQNRTSANKNSKSGIRGVYQLANGTWKARANLGEMTIDIGSFATAEAAKKASIEWRRQNMPASLNDLREVA